MPPITVSDLAIAPVKGLRLARVDRLEIGSSGPVGDRAFVVVDEGGRLLRTTATPKLLQVEQSWDPASGVLTLRFPGGGEVASFPESAERSSTALYNQRRVEGRLVAGPLAEALSGHLGRPVRLLALDEGQTGADDFPVTLMSAATLASLGQALEDGEPDPRRFRMTVTVEGPAAWEEHDWGGRAVRAGEVTLCVAEPVPRCVVTTRDPDSGRGDLPVLKALSGLRGKDDVTFGVWCSVVEPGRIRLGDPVNLVSPG